MLLQKYIHSPYATTTNLVRLFNSFTLGFLTEFKVVYPKNHITTLNITDVILVRRIGRFGFARGFGLVC